MENETNNNETREQLTDEEVLAFINKEENNENDGTNNNTASTPTTVYKIDKEGVASILDEEKSEETHTENKTPMPEPSRVVLNFMDVFKFDPEVFKKLIEKIEISDDEKDNYLRSVLLNIPFRTDIALNKSKLTFGFRTKYVYEQELIQRYMLSPSTYVNLHDTNIDDHILNLNLVLLLTHVKHKTYAFSSNEFGTIDENTTLEDFTIITKKRIDNLKTISNTLYTMLKTALFIFNYKEKLLGEFMLNEDFC